jgi:hypothetical protein
MFGKLFGHAAERSDFLDTNVLCRLHGLVLFENDADAFAIEGIARTMPRQVIQSNQADTGNPGECAM